MRREGGQDIAGPNRQTNGDDWARKGLERAGWGYEGTWGCIEGIGIGKMQKTNEKMNSKNGVRCMRIRAKASRWFLGGADKIVNIVMGSGNILLLDNKAKARKRRGDARPASDARASHEAQGDEEC